MITLTPHFTLEELTRSETAERRGWNNVPGPKEFENLKRVAALLEQVRVAVGNRPIMVTSGFRNKQVNDAIGSTDRSQHRLGCAADFRVPGMTPRQVVQACIDADIPFDQIILEFDSWVHISVPDSPLLHLRGSKLIIDRRGTRVFA